MGGEIGLAGIGQHVFVIVLAQGLQRVADSRLEMAVVEEQAGAAIGAIRSAIASISAAARRRGLDDRALRRVCGIGRQQRRIERAGAGEEGSSPPSSRPTTRSRQPVPALTIGGWASRRRIRCRRSAAAVCGSLSIAFVPADRGRRAGERLPSGHRPAAGWSRSGRTTHRRPGRVEPLKRAQHVLHQRAAAGADLGDA